MLNNLTNFLSIFTKGRLKKTLNDSDIIPIGTRDPKFGGGYKPTAARFSLIKEKILAEVPPGASSFEELTDTPTYAGNAKKAIRINVTEDALEAFTSSDTDTNSWGMDTVAFVSPTANFGTGAIGFANTQLSADTSNTAFRTVAEANASGATLIILLPGYHSNVDAANGVTYYAYPEARIYRFRSTTSNVSAKLRGFAKIEYGVEITGNDCNLDIVCDRFESRFFANIANTSTNNHVRIVADKCLQTSSWSGAYACRGGSNGSIEIYCNEMQLLYWLYASRNYNSTFKLRCPDVTVLSGGGFGNQYKSLINHQGIVAGNINYDIDFMGGKFETLAPQTSSFGVTDSALLLWTRTSTVDESTVRFANGRVKANAVQGVRATYQNRRGEIELDNIDLSSDTTAVVFWNQAVNAVGQNVNVTIRSCNIESASQLVVGNARFCKFYDTNIKVLTSAAAVTFDANNGATPGTAYFYNCNFDLVNPGETLINFTGISVGLANCYGDQPVGATVTDLYAGYTQLTPFELPNLLP